jgi:hypothetical protein
MDGWRNNFTHSYCRHCSGLRPGSITADGLPWVRGWVSSRINLDAVGKAKTPSCSRESKNQFLGSLFAVLVNTLTDIPACKPTGILDYEKKSQLQNLFGVKNW